MRVGTPLPHPGWRPSHPAVLALGTPRGCQSNLPRFSAESLIPTQRGGILGSGRFPEATKDLVKHVRWFFQRRIGFNSKSLPAAGH